MIKHIVSHSLIYSICVNAYLFIMMISTSPRVWGYNDYPQAVKDKVPPQTKREKTLAAVIGLPWLILIISYPIITAYMLKAKLGDAFSFWVGFSHFAVMILLANLGDLVILDWLIISKITPKFVVIPGSDPGDYKDFTHHFKGHAKATVIMVVLSLVLASIVRYI